MRRGHARWHGRAVVLALRPGSKNVWVASRHQLLKVWQGQLRMATITERVADDVIHQEFRAIGEQSAADGQVLPKYLDISRDHRHHRLNSSRRQVWKKEPSDMNDSKIEVRCTWYKKALHHLTTQKLRPLLESLRPH